MAALILAIGWRDRWLGMRLASTATATLVRRDLRERHHWPWADAIARIHMAARDLDAMLRAGGETADAAVTALMSHDFHRSGRPGPVHHLSGRARQRLLALPRTADWALAAAACRFLAGFDSGGRHPSVASWACHSCGR